MLEEKNVREVQSRPVLLDEKAAAAYLGGISPKTLQAWRVRGVGPVYRKIGSLCRYLQADLNAWIEGRARQSTAQKVSQ